MNREKWLLLQMNVIFWSDIKRLRKLWKVPRDLNPYTDIQNIPCGDGEIIDSEWFHGGGASTDAMDKDMKALLVKHDLPYSFYDLVQYSILYQKTPREGSPEMIEAIHDFGLLNTVIHDPSEVDRFPLTAADKRYILFRFRERIGIKAGRPPARYARALTELRQILSRAKNSSRRHPTLEESIKVMDLKNRQHTDGSRRTFADVVDELDPDSLSRLARDDRALARTRQRVLRLKKRNENKVKKNIKK